MGFRNIIGLSDEKSENDIYHQYIHKFDIIFLPYTWKLKNSIKKLQHSVGYFHGNIYKKTKKGPASRGILVVIGKN